MVSNRKADGGLLIAAAVVDSVVLLHKDVADDPQRAAGLGDVERHEALLAHAGVHNGLDHVPLGLERVAVLALAVLEHVRDRGQVLQAGAGAGLGADGIEHLVDVAGRARLERGSGVDDGLAGAVGAQAKGLAVDEDVDHVDLPVELLRDLDVVNRTGVEVAVGLAQDHVRLAVRPAGRVVERERVVREQVLLHDRVEHRGVAGGAERGERETENTVELDIHEHLALLLGDLAEGLVADVDGAQVEGVLAEEALDAACAELHRHLDVHAAERARQPRLEHAVDLARRGRARVTRDPQVRGTGVKDDLEHLARGADLDGTDVLRVVDLVDRELVLVHHAVLAHAHVGALEAEVGEDLVGLALGESVALGDERALLLLRDLDLVQDSHSLRGQSLSRHLGVGLKRRVVKIELREELTVLRRRLGQEVEGDTTRAMLGDWLLSRGLVDVLNLSELLRRRHRRRKCCGGKQDHQQQDRHQNFHSGGEAHTAGTVRAKKNMQ